MLDLSKSHISACPPAAASVLWNAVAAVTVLDPAQHKVCAIGVGAKHLPGRLAPLDLPLEHIPPGHRCGPVMTLLRCNRCNAIDGWAVNCSPRLIPGEERPHRLQIPAPTCLARPPKVRESVDLIDSQTAARMGARDLVLTVSPRASAGVPFPTISHVCSTTGQKALAAVCLNAAVASSINSCC